MIGIFQKSLNLICLLYCLSINPKLFYWKPSTYEDNFGDALSPLIVEKIIGKPLNKKISKRQLLAIGSILQFAQDGDVVWGSGLNGNISKAMHNFTTLDVRAVRGPITRKFLQSRNIPCPEIYGDPALLMPILFPDLRPNPKEDYIVIPNIREISYYEGLANLVLPTEDCMDVVNKILEAKLVISGSLHGIIVAESFGIPAILLRLTDIPSLLKYQDYYAGTGRDEFPIAYTVEEALSIEKAPPPKFDAAALLGSFPAELFDHSDTLIRDLVDVNYQKASKPDALELFQLEPHFFEELTEEVLQLIEAYNPSVPSDKGHLSNWTEPEGLITQYSLLNSSGKFDDYSTDHNRSIKRKKFAYAKTYPKLGALINAMPHAVNFRINVLYPGSCFTQHREDLCFERVKTGDPALRVRFHLPILTNPDAKMLLNGSIYHFDPGTVYFFHNGAIHDGVNHHDSSPRIHLLWDMLLTEDTYQRMFQRSIAVPFLTKSPSTELTPLYQIEIDPDYKQVPFKIPYEEALKATLCPVQ